MAWFFLLERNGLRNYSLPISPLELCSLGLSKNPLSCFVHFFGAKKRNQRSIHLTKPSCVPLVASGKAERPIWKDVIDYGQRPPFIKVFLYGSQSLCPFGASHDLYLALRATIIIYTMLKHSGSAARLGADSPDELGGWERALRERDNFIELSNSQGECLGNDGNP